VLTSLHIENIISKKSIKEIVIILIGISVIWLSMQMIFGTYNPFYVVSSGSMIPELQVFDVLVVQGNYEFSEITIGDIIVFDKPISKDRVIVHRVNSIMNDEPKIIRTKGDANMESIPGVDFPITEEEYRGKVIYAIPYIGHVIRFLSPPINYVIIGVVLTIMIYNRIKKNKK